MEAKTQAQLAQARAYFYAWKMPEAYNILRRYFDRLPFAPEKEHAEYVGMFCRVLMELGKEFELKFYLNELERIYERTRDPHFAYTLGVVYSYSSEPRGQSAKALFESILSNNPSPVLKAKTKMMLADHYLIVRDITSCRMIVDSIEATGDPDVDSLATIWRAVVARREKRGEEAIAILDKFFKEYKAEGSSYAFLSAKIVYVTALLELRQISRANDEIAAVRKLVEGKNLKSTQEQIRELEKLLQKTGELDVIRFEQGEFQSAFIYGEKKVFINEKSPGEKLLLLLMKKGFVDKALIVKTLYGRQYTPDDDKLIYYHIHSLRKRLKDLGIPAEAIATENEGYRLVPEVETIRSSHENNI